MRLVDADKLFKVIAEQETWNVPDFVYESIKNAPTVDAVKVVRCRDCKWWDEDDNDFYGYCMAMKHGYMSANWEIGIYRKYKGDFYCADGERREDGAERK